MKNIRIVLVRTKYPRNIGMVSRLMENFGVEKLLLVNPQCELTYEAQQGAAQGQEALRNVQIYPTWESGPLRFTRKPAKHESLPCRSYGSSELL